MNNFCFKVFCFLGLLFGFVNTNAQTEVELECVNTDTTIGTTIQWSAHNCAGTFSGYTLWMSTDPSITFIEKATISTNTFTTVTDVDDPGVPHYFFVTYECNGVQSAPSDTISNQDIKLPEIYKVTVNGSQVEIEWEIIDASNVGGYDIEYINDFGNNDVVESITTLQAGTGVWSVAANPNSGDPNDGPVSLAVFATDKCGLWGTGNPEDLFHQTIHLQKGLSDCASTIPISWTHYQGWGGVLQYRILNGSTLIDAVDGAINTYNIATTTNLQNIRVQAIHPNGATNSNSNYIEINPASQTLPEVLRLYSATAPDGDKLYLGFEYSENASVDYRILRGVASENDLVEGNIITPDGSPFFTIDADAKPESFSYYYRIQAKDDCEATKQSNYVRTVLLKAADNFNQQITLTWNEFELEGASIEDYELYRFDAPKGSEPILIHTIESGESLEYTDDVTDVNSAEPDGYQYQVKVNYKVQLVSEPNVVDADSYSNIVFPVKNSQIVGVPTAFRPNGINNEFKPTIDFENNEAYRLTIINRWGEKIFESDNPAIGWNGLVDGTLAPQGVYAYVIKMKSFNSRDLIRKGTVLLVR